MITSQQVVGEFIRVLEENIEDVNRFRTGKKWIYDDLPRADLNSYPRISVISPSSPTSPLDIGYNYEVGDFNIQIMIFVKQKQKLTINGKVMRDVQILDHLSSKIIELFKTKNILNLEGLIGNKPILVTESNPLPTSDGRLLKVLIYKNKFMR